MKYHLLLIFSVIFIFFSALLCQAQPELGRAARSLKYAKQARATAITNTILPVLTGIGAAYIFKGRTVRKAAGLLAVYGLIVGPSTGNFYAEDYGRGSLGALARLGAGYMLKDMTREVLGKDISEPLGWDKKHQTFSDTKVLVGAGIMVASMVYNVLSAKASVREHNAQLGYPYIVSLEKVGNEYYPALSARITF